MSKNVYGSKNTQDQASITEMFGISKDIVEYDINAKVEPKIHKICQTEFET